MAVTDDDPGALPDDALERLIAELEARRPGAPIASGGVRPRRQPWSYREIWRLDAARAERDRRRAARGSTS